MDVRLIKYVNLFYLQAKECMIILQDATYSQQEQTTAMQVFVTF